MQAKATIWISAIALVVQSGCVWFPPDYPGEEDRARVGTVGVVTARFAPEIEAPEAITKGETIGGGAALGATAGAAAGLVIGAVTLIGALSSCLFAPPTCPAVAPFVLGGAAAGGVAGATVGAASETSSVPGEEAQASFNTALDERVIQDLVHARVMEYARGRVSDEMVEVSDPGPANRDARPDYAPLRQRGIDTVLEISVLKVGLNPHGRRSFLGEQLFLVEATVRARLVRTSDNAVLYDKTFYSGSEYRGLGEWIDNNAERLLTALDRTYQNLSEYLVDETFLLYDVTVYDQTADDVLDNIVGLSFRPRGLLLEYPGDIRPLTIWHLLDRVGEKDKTVEIQRFFLSGTRWRSFNQAIQVDSLRPALRWQPFSKAGGLATERALPWDRLSNVRYQLRLYRAREVITKFGDNVWVPGELALSRNGLAVARHELQTPLVACAKYFWTVRARFDLDGQSRVTEWATALSPLPPKQLRFKTGPHLPTLGTDPYTLRGLARAPSTYYYAFATPCPDGTDKPEKTAPN